MNNEQISILKEKEAVENALDQRRAVQYEEAGCEKCGEDQTREQACIEEKEDED